MTAAPETPKTEQAFEADVSRILHLVINSLYSHREVFLRELISNASDALDKLRFRAIAEPALLGDDPELRVRIIPDEAAGTLTVWDNGIGMTQEDLTKDLGTIARSGSRELMEKLDLAQERAKQGDLSLIGQFGVGFYSAFLVADRVSVTSRAALSEEAFTWSSDGKATFTLEPAERDMRGTSVVLHLGAEHREFLAPHRIRELVARYSDYLGHPIELSVKADDGGQKLERINTGQALWRRTPSDVDKDQYDNFYEHLTGDFTEPLAHRHFRIEGTQEFVGLVFIPKTAPLDLFIPDAKHGVRLHVKRVFVMDDCAELLPRWLRFVRGVVDSEDLPLNVSRETLQDSRIVRTIRKAVVKQVLDLLTEMARERPEDYASFWKSFGAVLKEGLHFEPEHRERLRELMRYQTTHGEGLVSLAEYKARMKEGQKAIYYALGESRERAASSPHLEGLKSQGFEVLLMTDAVDPWAVSGLTEYDGVPLQSATDENLSLGETEGGEDESLAAESMGPLCARFRVRLQDHVSEVRVSKRLTDSPVCLVVPEGGLQPWIERILRATEKGDALPKSKRILEINPNHPVVQNLKKLLDGKDQAAPLDAWIDLLFEQALLAEGSPLEDPAGFARRLTGLLEERTELAVQKLG